MTLKIGDIAPSFKLHDTERKEISLTDYNGKIILLAFFPGAFTGACTKEMCAFRDSMNNLNEINAQVLGISVDSPFSNKSFSEFNKLNFPILSDYTRSVSELYGGLYTDFAGLKGYSVAKRAVFVIDVNHIIRYIWITEEPGVEPPYDEIKNIISLI